MQGSDLIWFASAVPGRIDPKKSLCLKSWVPAGPGIDQAAQRRTHSEASFKYTERKNDRPTETAAPDTQNVGRKVWNDTNTRPRESRKSLALGKKQNCLRRIHGYGEGGAPGYQSSLIEHCTVIFGFPSGLAAGRGFKCEF